MQRALSEYYGTPGFSGLVCRTQEAANGTGFFRFGPKVVCYGQTATGVVSSVHDLHLRDARKDTKISEREISLPFDVDRVVQDLRLEHYSKDISSEANFWKHSILRKSYYAVRPHLPAWLRSRLQTIYLGSWQDLVFPRWPVDFTVDLLHESLLGLAMQATDLEKVPFIWFWPDGASSCLIMTHDVETAEGRDFCSKLMDLDLSWGFTSSFQVIPEQRYEVREDFVAEIRARGFEFNLHDLNHDGLLFDDREEFLRRAKKINEYARKYQAQGYRSGVMYRNQDWYDAFEFSYDLSVPTVAHLEPQRGGCCTVMPYFVGKILELPLTTTQDYSIFNILRDYRIDLWKDQVDLIRRRNGLISFISHPDWLIGSRARGVYESLLAHLRAVVDQNEVWMALPGDVDRWWRSRSQMRLVQDGGEWKVEGPGSERACVAYARLDGNRVVYAMDQPSHTCP